MKVNLTANQSAKADREVYAATVTRPPVTKVPTLKLVTSRGDIVVKFASLAELEEVAAGLAQDAELATVIGLAPFREPDVAPGAGTNNGGGGALAGNTGAVGEAAEGP